jgi:hypothetical protein
MSDDLKNRGPADASRVNVNEEWELRYWTEKFGVSAEQLKLAVRAAGTSVEKVRHALNK